MNKSAVVGCTFVHVKLEEIMIESELTDRQKRNIKQSFRQAKDRLERAIERASAEDYSTAHDMLERLRNDIKILRQTLKKTKVF